MQAKRNSDKQKNCDADYSHAPVLEPHSLHVSDNSHPALGKDDQQPRPHTKENLNAETAMRIDKPPCSFAQGNAGQGSGFTTTTSPSRGNPLFIEICAGTAMLSRCFKEAGFDAVAIDHSKNRFHPLAHICNIDLTTVHGWQFLDHLIEHYNVIFVHAAPPCGTCSRAREIKLAGWCPQPLRTEDEPAGLSTLQGEDLERVQAANAIYSGLSNFLVKCSRLSIHWSVENPARSLLWCTPWFKPLIQLATFYNFEACAWGSKRKTDKSFLSTLPQMCQIQAVCPGNHEHEPYGRKRDAHGKIVYATADEAAYPRELALQVVHIVSNALNIFPESSRATIQNTPANAAGTVATAKQPRGQRMAPIISEFAAITTISSDTKPPVDTKQRLTTVWHGTPKGAKLLKIFASGGEKSRFNCTFGIYRTPLSWIHEAKKVEHPFDVFHAVPDHLLRVLFDIVTLGPVAIMKMRNEKLNKWLTWAAELNVQEGELKLTMEAGVREILKDKRVLLLKRIAMDIGWVDMKFFDELCEGFKLTGLQDPSGIFPLEPRPMEFSPSELDDAMKFLRPALLGKVRASSSDTSNGDDAKLLWDMTVEESNNKHWLEGPLTPEVVNKLHPEGWVPVRRFGVWQSSGDKVKLRPIDDYAENRVNGAYGYSDKLDLRTLDQMIWLCSAIARINDTGRVLLQLQDGTILDGVQHPDWKSGGKGEMMLCVLDLSNAYKQLPLSPSCRKYSIVTLVNPNTGEPACFEGKVLPFGSTASVVHFNRCARLIQCIGWHLHILWGNYFDDFPILSLAGLNDSTVNSVTLLLRLLGFDYAKHKLKEFSKSAAVLGVELDLNEVAGKGILIRNKPGRIEEVLDSIDAVLESGSTTTREASRILGRLQYVDSFIMGRDGRLAMCELRNNLRADGKKISLPPQTCSSLALLKQRLLCGEPRRVPWRHDPDPPLVFTDGASEGDLHTIGGVVISSAGVQYFGCHVPDQLVRLWLESSKHISGMVEMYGALVARTVWASLLAGRKSILFVDNNAAKEAFVKGTSYNKHYRQMLVSLERLESKSRSWTWVARVPSHSNPADEPSRGIHTGIISALNATQVSCTCPLTDCILDVYRTD